ncbi:hypothetical protein O988_02240 [Pseudogymnoascus sp. VKM F-3808]|nr:hypothetical protein O988_02240 [Pseudogymnoascus sp. VKM F-3808]
MGKFSYHSNSPCNFHPRFSYPGVSKRRWNEGQTQGENQRLRREVEKEMKKADAAAAAAEAAAYGPTPIQRLRRAELLAEKADYLKKFTASDAKEVEEGEEESDGAEIPPNLVELDFIPAELSSSRMGLSETREDIMEEVGGNVAKKKEGNIMKEERVDVVKNENEADMKEEGANVPKEGEEANFAVEAAMSCQHIHDIARFYQNTQAHVLLPIFPQVVTSATKSFPQSPPSKNSAATSPSRGGAPGRPPETLKRLTQPHLYSVYNDWSDLWSWRRIISRFTAGVMTAGY